MVTLRKYVVTVSVTLIVVIGIFAWAWAFVSAIDNRRLRECSGQYDTTQCRVDREAQNAKNYEAKKARQ